VSKAPKPARRSRNALAQGKRVTIKDVARHAGVGWITVSRVMRAPEKVSAILRHRVHTAIDDLGYVANQAASGLASGACRIVPVLIPTLSHSVYVPFLDGVHEELDRHGYEILLGTTNYDVEVEARLAATFLGWFPAGILVAGVDHSAATRKRLTQAVAQGTPVIEFMDLTDDPIDINVGMSHSATGVAVAEFFADRGYRHIAYAGTLGERDPRGSRRLEGFRDTLRARGLPSHYAVMGSELFSMGLGAKLLTELLERFPQVEAVSFANDDLAAGAVLEARRRNIAIPQRLAIMGFSDLEIATVLSPAISSVRVDQKGIGRLAAQKLIAALAGTPDCRRSVDVGFEIIERDTTRLKGSLPS
jgi:LacI family gluconate utilization system Gnt-I transcriptional repressor